MFIFEKPLFLVFTLDDGEEESEHSVYFLLSIADFGDETQGEFLQTFFTSIKEIFVKF